MSIFTGCATAMVTPFSDGNVDFEALGTLIDFQLKNEIDALVMCGTTGEASTMTFDERMSVIDFTVKRVNGRVPVIAGTGGNNTAEVIRASKAAQELHTDALLIVTPYYNKTSQTGLLVHYNAVADEVNIPIIAYNVPNRTGLNIQPATMQKMLEHRNIVGIKEASGDIGQIVELASRCPDCEIYCGNDDHVIPVMSIGGMGVISTISNVIPRDMHDMCTAYLEGDIVRAKNLQFKIHPIWRAAFSDVNPIPIKAMLSILGYCEQELRLPLLPPSAETIEMLERIIDEYEIAPSEQRV